MSMIVSGFSVSTRVSTEIHPSYARVSTKTVVKAVSNASSIPGWHLKRSVTFCIIVPPFLDFSTDRPPRGRHRNCHSYLIARSLVECSRFLLQMPFDADEGA